MWGISGLAAILKEDSAPWSKYVIFFSFIDY
jgi:hypothetical protein